ncbi:fumarate hydratase [Vulgatibacter incomptus]|uniref:Fumarate hydratase class I, aerobic n=1 Tax=Vulgatibacter incomptus TaxID=1391653 RepID=A0A0K1P8B9_9BACT|nr:fumarate hydratase [Vulgatibacter incomptus]AKU89760.1 Fumarate hydratase class I, aerobic [Vulgatibacter incomptus]
MATLRPQLLELIRHTSSGLPEDVLDALARARDLETEGSRAWSTFELMIQNVEAAREASAPICQDTGTLIFYVDYGPDHTAHALEKEIVDAVREATKRSYLRPNAVDSITGQNSGDNVGNGSPYIHFHARKEKGVQVRLMMKGGGCENVGGQYSLPDESIGAGRDLDGIRRCIIDAVQKAQGYGCAPGTVGVGVGGDRVTSYIESKEQLFRPLYDENPNATLAALEQELTGSLQGLNIGPMGFGGKTTVLGVKIGARHRVPASFFVSISYMCWAYRKGELVVKGQKAHLDGRPLAVAVPKRKAASAATAAKVAGGKAAAKAPAKAAGKTVAKAPAKAAGKTVAKAPAKAAGRTVAKAPAKAAGKTVAKAPAKAAGKTLAKAPATTAAKAAAKKAAPKSTGKKPAVAIPSRRATRRKLPIL